MYPRIKRRQYNVNNITPGWNLIMNIIMIIFALLCILPVYLVYAVSFTSEQDFINYGYSLIPKHFSIEAYKFFMYTINQIITSYAVSIVVTVAGTLLSLFLMSMFAYVLSRKNFKYRYQFSLYVAFTILFNGGLVPSYIINATVLHLSDTIFALILPYTINAFYLLVLRTFYSTAIPDSVIESAKIDGAGELITFIRIVIPLSKPGLATIGLFTVIGYWNDWWLALLYINVNNLTPIQYVLMKVQSQLEFLKTSSQFLSSADGAALATNIPTESGRMALTVIVMTPILFAYPFFQKYFVKGLTLGSIKG